MKMFIGNPARVPVANKMNYLNCVFVDEEFGRIASIICHSILNPQSNKRRDNQKVEIRGLSAVEMRRLWLDLLQVLLTKIIGKELIENPRLVGDQLPDDESESASAYHTTINIVSYHLHKYVFFGKANLVYHDSEDGNIVKVPLPSDKGCLS